MLPTQEGGRKEPFFNKYRPLCFLYNHVTTCEITITSGSPMVVPGDHVIVDIELLYSMMVVPGMRFSIRDGSQIVGIGIVTEILI
jgi:elongation factor Tu